MKKLLIGISLLFLSTFTVHAETAGGASAIAPLPEYSEFAQRLIKQHVRGTVSEKTVASFRGTAEHLVATERFKEAIPLLEFIAANRPGSRSDWLQLQDIYHRTGSKRTIDAATQLLLLARNKQERFEAYLRLYRLHAERKTWNKAKEALVNASEIDSSSLIDARLAEVDKLLASASVSRLRKSYDLPAAFCIDFSKRFVFQESIDYRKYLRLEPAHDFQVKLEYSDLCLAQLEYGQEYKVEILPGMPVSDKLTLGKGYSESFQIDNKESELSFNSRYYILPMHGAQSVPLTTTNIDRADVSLHHVNDRNLVDMINRYGLHETLSLSKQRSIDDENGKLIWNADLRIRHNRNTKQVTALPLKEHWPEPEPGIYVLTAKQHVEDDEWESSSTELATQWLLVSDLGLYSLKGKDGMHLFVRSLKEGTPRSGVTLKLLSINNAVLGEAVTDANGYARFSPGLLAGKKANTARAVLAYDGSEDFNLLSLDAASHDLSDRGVTGRLAPGPIDAFLYTDRGIYRPGEEVHLSALLRNDQGEILADLPVMLKLLRPNQSVAEEMPLTSDMTGYLQTGISLAPNAPGGSWRLEAWSGDRIVGQKKLQVEDFVPPRIHVDVEVDQRVMVQGEAVTFDVSSRFLYGGKVEGAIVEGEVTLKQVSSPYADYKAFDFSNPKLNREPEKFLIDRNETDAEGKVRLAYILPDLETTLPLVAQVRISVYEPGGRPVHRLVTLPVRQADYAVGIKPRFDGRAVGESDAASFDIVLLHHEEPAVEEQSLAYRVVRENHLGDWSYVDGKWKYEEKVMDAETVAEGTVTVLPGELGALQLESLAWGHYRLEITGPVDVVTTAYRFESGWYDSGLTGGPPDKLRIALDKEQYEIGETARLHIHPRFSGPALLTVSDSRLLHQQRLVLDKDGDNTIPIPTSAAWGAGTYIMVTAFRPADAQADLMPNRAIGVIHLSLGSERRRLDVAIDAPERVNSREELIVPVTISGSPDSEAFVTLAAVDEGVLRMTDFKTPDALDHFYGQRRMGIDIKDIYARLIRSEGVPGEFNVGGGGSEESDAAAPLNIVRTRKVVALFSGKLQTDSQGRALVHLDIPDYQGELRLMAVAWDGSGKVGKAEKSLRIADTLRAELYLPRFMATGDKAKVRLRFIRNDAVPAGKYNLRIESDNNVTFDRSEFTVSVPAGDQPDVLFDSQLTMMAGATVTPASITVSYDKADGSRRTQDWQIMVRASGPASYENRTEQLVLNNPVTFDDLGREWLSSEVAVHSHALIDRGPLEKQLRDYAYRCGEQTTSRGYVGLYGDTGLDSGNRQVTRNAIARVLTLQHYTGAFSLWPESFSEDYWLSAYVLDFLLEARKAGYQLPDSQLREGIAWLRRQIARDSIEPDSIFQDSYALYVMNKAGEDVLDDLRYYLDQKTKYFDSPMVAALLGSAIASHGDKARADKAFAFSSERIASGKVGYRHYGSLLRETAAYIALAAEAGRTPTELGSDYARLVRYVGKRNYLSTQELAWLIRAAKAMEVPPKAFDLLVDGRRIEQVDSWEESASSPGGLPTVSNPQADPLWMQFSGRSIRKTATGSGGYSISKQLYRLDGTPLAPASIKQNERVVVVIEGTVGKSPDRTPLVVDLIPAGLELENPRLQGIDTVATLNWLKKRTYTNYTEYRDDRFVAALDIPSGKQKFRLAYVAQAVTEGDFVVPSALIENMYAPEDRATSHASRLDVQPK